MSIAQAGSRRACDGGSRASPALNGRERYEALLSGAPVDYLPRVPILMQFAAEHIGSDYGRYVYDHRVLAEAHLRCAEDFGMDQLSAISDPYRETAGFGAEIRFEPSGPRCDRPPLADGRSLDSLACPDPYSSPRMLDRLRAIERYRASAQDTHSIMGWVEGPAAEAACLRGISAFLMDFFDDEGFACALMDRCLEVAIDFARAQVKAGADTLGIGDAIASQISPGLYESLVQPRQLELLSAVRAMGARVRLHICGDITHLLPGIAALPLDVLDVDHMVDLATVRAALPKDVALAGNLDPVSGVAQGTPDSIRRALLGCYQVAGNPFLVNAGCEIPPGTPPENLRALCEPLHYRA